MAGWTKLFLPPPIKRGGEDSAYFSGIGNRPGSNGSSPGMRGGGNTRLRKQDRGYADTGQYFSLAILAGRGPIAANQYPALPIPTLKSYLRRIKDQVLEIQLTVRRLGEYGH